MVKYITYNDEFLNKNFNIFSICFSNRYYIFLSGKKRKSHTSACFRRCYRTYRREHSQEVANSWCWLFWIWNMILHITLSLLQQLEKFKNKLYRKIINQLQKILFDPALKDHVILFRHKTILHLMVFIWKVFIDYNISYMLNSR